MDNNQGHNQELNKSVDDLIEEFFVESTVVKSGDPLNIAGDAKTTADAALASTPGSENDNNNPGRPRQQHTVSEGGDASYDGQIASPQSEEENEEAKKQSGASTQISEQGRTASNPSSSNDPRGPMFKSQAEWDEYQTLKNEKQAQLKKAEDNKKADDLKKSEDLRKVEQQQIIQKAVTDAIVPIQKQNEELKKSVESQAKIIKAMSLQPVSAKSITSIEALEKSQDPSSTVNGPTEFSKSEKLDAAERLVMKKSLPMEAVVELENTGTLYNPAWRALVEQELQKN